MLSHFPSPSGKHVCVDLNGVDLKFDLLNLHHRLGSYMVDPERTYIDLPPETFAENLERTGLPSLVAQIMNTWIFYLHFIEKLNNNNYQMIYLIYFRFFIPSGMDLNLALKSKYLRNVYELLLRLTSSSLNSCTFDCSVTFLSCGTRIPKLALAEINKIFYTSHVSVAFTQQCSTLTTTVG